MTPFSVTHKFNKKTLVAPPINYGDGVVVYTKRPGSKQLFRATNDWGRANTVAEAKVHHSAFEVDQFIVHLNRILPGYIFEIRPASPLPD